MSQELTVSEYLAKRLQEIGANNIFGVVVDYVLDLMNVFLETEYSTLEISPITARFR